MNNIILPLAIWTALLLMGFGVVGMAVAGLRSVWYGKVEPLTVALVSVPLVLFVLLRGVVGTWMHAGIYTLVVLFALLLLALVGTGLRQAVQESFS